MFFFLRILLPPRSTRTDTPFPYPTLFRPIEPRGRPRRHRAEARRDAGGGAESTLAPHARAVELPRQHACHPRRPSRDIEPPRHHRGLRQRSEEHTSELQSLMRISYAVFCLTQKKTTNTNDIILITDH